MEKKPMDEDADPQYRVGKGHIRLEDLDLLGLEHVSVESWQVLVRLRTEGSLLPAHSDGRLKTKPIQAMHNQTRLEDDNNVNMDAKFMALPLDSTLLKPFQSDHPNSSSDGMQSVSDVYLPRW